MQIEMERECSQVLCGFTKGILTSDEPKHQFETHSMRHTLQIYRTVELSRVRRFELTTRARGPTHRHSVDARARPGAPEDAGEDVDDGRRKRRREHERRTHIDSACAQLDRLRRPSAGAAAATAARQAMVRAVTKRASQPGCGAQKRWPRCGLLLLASGST